MNSLFSLSDSFVLSISWGRGLAAAQSGQFLQRRPATGEEPVPGSVLQALHLFYRSQWCSPLGRFHRHLVRSTRAALVAAPHNSASPCSGRVSSDVFPLPTPLLDAEFRGVDGKAFPQLLERPEEWRSLGAARLTSLLCSALSFFHCGCPRGKVVLDLHHGEVTYAQREVFRRLEKEAICFCSSDGGDIIAGGRGRARLANAIVESAHCMQR